MEWLIALISALVSGGFSLAVCIINNNAQARKRDIEQDKHITEIKNELHEQILELNAAYQQNVAIITCKLEELDKKQEIHNKVIERVYGLETGFSVMDNRLSHLERNARAIS